MALQPIQAPIKEGKKGGGLFGKIAGGLAGLGVGTVTGNPIAGMAVGQKVGQTVGGAVSPAKGASQQKTVPLQQMAKKDPGVQLAQLMEAQKELIAAPDIPEPEKEQVNIEIFTPAIEALKKRRNV